jgi:methylenetetrahydrofolate reductase (NADPH)
MKLIDSIREAVGHNRRFFGLEFFPPNAAAAKSNLYARVEHMTNTTNPLFCSVTWGCGGTTAADTLEIARNMHGILSTDVQVHLTSSGLTKAQARKYLDEIKAIGVTNLTIIGGVKNSSSSAAASNVVQFNSAATAASTDPAAVPPPRTASTEDAATLNDADGDFPFSVDLIRFIREEHGDHFGICVAGYPEGHEDCSSPEEGLRHLKAKIDAGADVVITHMVFSPEVFLKFCTDCRAAGIACPIIPGIMPVHSYRQFRRWSARGMAGLDILEGMLKNVSTNDDAEVKRIGIEFTAQVIRSLMKSGVRGVYLFTMNLEVTVMSILQHVGLANRDVTSAQRALPWRTSCDDARREREDVRPIFWSGRSKSWFARTAEWDEFPNGRWGNTRSPAYGEDQHHTHLVLNAAAQRCVWMHSVATVADLCRGFVGFLEGKTTLPWCDDLALEADLLMDSVLKPLNRRGVLTINSQPAVNGVASEDKIVGWGPPGGNVYQKQYLEFFCPSSLLSTVLDVFAAHPSLTFMASDAASKNLRTNAKNEACVMAVTWGVFPEQEVVQPTIVSAEAFRAWVPEAFALWTAPFASHDCGHVVSGSVPDVVSAVLADWALVNVVDHKFTTAAAGGSVTPATPLDEAVHQLVDMLPALC